MKGRFFARTAEALDDLESVQSISHSYTGQLNETGYNENPEAMSATMNTMIEFLAKFYQSDDLNQQVSVLKSSKRVLNEYVLNSNSIDNMLKSQSQPILRDSTTNDRLKYLEYLAILLSIYYFPLSSQPHLGTQLADVIVSWKRSCEWILEFFKTAYSYNKSEASVIWSIGVNRVCSYAYFLLRSNVNMHEINEYAKNLNSLMSLSLQYDVKLVPCLNYSILHSRSLSNFPMQRVLDVTKALLDFCDNWHDEGKNLIPVVIDSKVEMFHALVISIKLLHPCDIIDWYEETCYNHQISSILQSLRSLSNHAQVILNSRHLRKDIIITVGMAFSSILVLVHQIEIAGFKDETRVVFATYEIIKRLLEQLNLLTGFDELQELNVDRVYDIQQTHLVAFNDGILHMISTCVDWPFVSKAAVAKGVLSNFPDILFRFCRRFSYESHLLVLNEYCGVSLVMDVFPLLSDRFCKHNSPEIRIFGLQMIEAWVNIFDVPNRFEEILQEDQNDQIILPMPLDVLKISIDDSVSCEQEDKRIPIELGMHNADCQHFRSAGDLSESVKDHHQDLKVKTSNSSQFIDVVKNLFSLVSRSWEHPVRQVNHLVPSIYERLVVMSARIQRKLERNVNCDSLPNYLFQVAMNMNPNHRSKYQALNILIRHFSMGVVQLAQSDNISSLLRSMENRDIAASISGLISNLFQFKSADSITISFTEAIANALSSKNYKIRVHTAEYLLPELLKKDLDNMCISIVKHIRLIAGETIENRHLWAFVNICFQARLINDSSSCARIGDHSPDAYATLTPKEAKYCAIASDDNLRLTMLTTLVTGNKSSSFPNMEDFDVFKQTVKYSMKTSLPDHRQKLSRMIKVLLTRVSDSLTRLHKDILKIDASGANEKARSQRFSLQTTYDERASFMRKILAWLACEILESLTFKATMEREVIALEFFQCIIDTIGQCQPLLSLYRSIFETKNMVFAVLACIATSNWDRSRSLASALTLRFALPLPGFSTLSETQFLIDWALSLVSSPKQRESEAGALMFRLVMSISSKTDNWVVIINTEGLIRIIEKQDAFVAHEYGRERNLDLKELDKTLHRRQFEFISMLADMISYRIPSLEKLFHVYQGKDACKDMPVLDINFSSASTNCLCHGLFRALRICLHHIFESSNNQLLLVNDFPTFLHLYEISNRCLDIAMMIVAETVSDEVFVTSVSKGPVNSATLSASYVNANSTVTIGCLDEDEIDIDTSDKVVQVAVVASWLLVKECLNLLCQIVQICVSSYGFFNETETVYDLISKVGLVILQSLGRLKHMGAIAETQQALQTVVSTLFLLAGDDQNLSRLPLFWMEITLLKLGIRLRDGDQEIESTCRQIFILRRSAGFAYTFQALLRGEMQRKGKSIMLPMCMRELLTCIRKNILVEKLPNTDNWKECVHCLNVIRLLIQDATFSADASGISDFLSESIHLAVLGFRSSRWAIRNSSMMVFTAAVIRAIGCGDKNADGGFLAPSTTFEDFFFRFPDLYSVFLDELNSVVDESSQLILYPMLLLLSKFRIAVVDSSPDVPYKWRVYADLIYQYLGHPSARLRGVAARSLSTLVPLKQITLSMKRIFASFSCRPNLNMMHGSLLAVHSMLRVIHTVLLSNPNEPITIEERTNFLFVELQSLLQDQLNNCYQSCKARIISCPSIGIVWLDVLRLLLNIMTNSVGRQVLKPTIVHLENDFVDSTLMHYLPEDSKRSPLPFESMLLRDCLTCKLIRTEKEEEILSIFNQYFDMNTNELREGILIGILTLMESDSAVTREFENFAETFMKNIFKCMKKETLDTNKDLVLRIAVRILVLIGKKPSTIENNIDSIEAKLVCNQSLHEISLLVLPHLLDSLKCQYQAKRGTRAYTTVIELVGHLIRVLNRKYNSSTSDLSEFFKQSLKVWSEEVEISSRIDQDINTREAALLSIIASDIIRPSVCDIWESKMSIDIESYRMSIGLLVLRLIQDDDPAIRNATLKNFNSYHCGTIHDCTEEYFFQEILPVILANLISSWLLAVIHGKSGFLSSADVEYSIIQGVDKILMTAAENLQRFVEICLPTTLKRFETGFEKVFERELPNQYCEESKQVEIILKSMQIAFDSIQSLCLTGDNKTHMTFVIFSTVLIWLRGLLKITGNQVDIISEVSNFESVTAQLNVYYQGTAWKTTSNIYRHIQFVSNFVKNYSNTIPVPREYLNEIDSITERFTRQTAEAISFYENQATTSSRWIF